MGLWTGHVLPRLTDRSLRAPGLDPLRERTCRGLHGRVLEIGFGSGLNLAHLPAGVSGVDAVEPVDAAWRLSAARRAASPVPVRRLGLDAQGIPAETASYDAALSTFSLCTIPDPVRALREVARVLRPGASLHLLEHGSAPDGSVARWQRRCEPLQRCVCGGCHLTRDPAALLEEAGLSDVTLRGGYLPGPALGRPWGYLHHGRARTGTASGPAAG
ncbi:class I SAM-dependent methyltransferase [Nocardioides sp. zg-DK7169]|uniref:class I SAM-dependent methyltransferase n=1 Tax=Nocardioides sp. zg-DK7169 TaxID=2736600 RepID=UPI0015555002|nr:class I SAM-dependent methyltransferase [Nocardioides sp. zg-DK7169]NPC96388.1 class I SAM-dependent methyltransferase [Nocardioides sp. zg-DK7169]